MIEDMNFDILIPKKVYLREGSLPSSLLYNLPGPLGIGCAYIQGKMKMRLGIGVNTINTNTGALVTTV